jgi:hypothetical protein
MSDIALKHGGTIDKFIGDAILIFFGDPETKGDAEDARACLRMAVEMRHRLAELKAKWRNAGLEQPFDVRMGINTGYCNVGNFGSSDRMDYTIIGMEANLAARLQSIAEPGQIVVSYETYALVRDLVVAHALAPITMKGISREVIPYTIESIIDEGGESLRVFSEHLTGLDFYLNANMIDPSTATHISEVLQNAVTVLEKRPLRPHRSVREVVKVSVETRHQRSRRGGSAEVDILKIWTGPPGGTRDCSGHRNGLVTASSNAVRQV